jgi:hypothetical protein
MPARECEMECEGEPDLQEEDVEEEEQEEEGRTDAFALEYAGHSAGSPGVFAGMVCIATVVTLWVGSSELIRKSHFLNFFSCACVQACTCVCVRARV